MKKNIKELIELKSEYNETFEKIKYTSQRSKLLFDVLDPDNASDNIEILHSSIMEALDNKILDINSQAAPNKLLNQYLILLKEKIQQAKDLLVFA